MQLSTGLRNAILSSTSFKGALDGSVLNIYSGSVPASADAALGSDNALLCTLSVDGAGTGLTWEAASGGVLTKSSSEVWKGSAIATGTITFFRLQLASDAGGGSTSAVRMQGTAGVLGYDLNMSSDSFTAGAIETLDYATVTLPASI